MSIRILQYILFVSLLVVDIFVLFKVIIPGMRRKFIIFWPESVKRLYYKYLTNSSNIDIKNIIKDCAIVDLPEFVDALDLILEYRFDTEFHASSWWTKKISELVPKNAESDEEKCILYMASSMWLLRTPIMEKKKTDDKVLCRVNLDKYKL